MTKDTELEEINSLIDGCLALAKSADISESDFRPSADPPDISEIIDVDQLGVLLGEAIDHGFLDYVAQNPVVYDLPDTLTYDMDNINAALIDFMKGVGKDV